ncbi:MAG: hypothetical protein R3236_01785, partial [Phycisphaeraceae bacterium]|nr:hypothetical protein [Phycisphaeraceae bacterium]
MAAVPPEPTTVESSPQTGQDAAQTPGPLTTFGQKVKENIKLAIRQYSVDKNRLLGYSAYINGRPQHAAIYFLACLDKRPDDLKSHFYLGKVALDHYNDPVYARRHLEQAFAQESKRIRKIENGRIIYKKFHETQVPWPGFDAIADALAESMQQSNDKAGLYQFLDHTIAKRGETADYIRKGRMLLKMNDVDNAQIAYRKALQQADRKDPRPYLAMAKFYESINHSEKELTFLRIVLYLDYDNKHVERRLKALDIVKGRTLALKPPPKPRKQRPGPKLPDIGGQELPG